MRSDTSRMIRFLAGHLVVGTVASAVVVGALFWTDALGLASLAARDAGGGVAVGLLAFGVWVTFGSVALGAGIMGIGRPAARDDRSDDDPGAGPRVAVPIRIRPRSGSRSSR